MEQEKKNNSFFDWGSSTSYRVHLRCTELHDRIWWFINMRWVAVLMCSAIWVVLKMEWFPIYLATKHVLWGVFALCLLNLVYIAIGQSILLKESGGNRATVRAFIRLQIFGDFAILSYLSYHAGTIESPIIMMFIPHIILASLFFTRIKSLLIALLAWLFAVLPLWLECQGILPMVTIFEGSFKGSFLADNCWIGRALLLAVGFSFLTIWYIVSEITTSLKLRESQLEDAFQLLKDMDAEKTQATLRATHELKAPFAAIKSYVYTLQDGYCGTLPEKAEKVVGRIGDRCDHLRIKISDIIHLSNIKTLVVSDVSLNAVNLNQILKEEVEECNLLGRERHVEVHLKIPDRPLFIRGSRAHLKTLFSNLIRNAVTYSYESEDVHVQVASDKEQISISVIDNGIGISVEHFERIFEEHFRSYEAVSHNPNGTGLGLPMVKELVRLHGGVLHLESEVNKGTTFNVVFKSVLPEKKEDSDDQNTDH